MLPACRRTSVYVLGELDATRFAASSHLHLGLHHDRITHASSDLDRLFDGVSDAAGRDRDAEASEVLLSLILKEIHSLPLSLLCREKRTGLLAYFARIECGFEPRADLVE